MRAAEDARDSRSDWPQLQEAALVVALEEGMERRVLFEEVLELENTLARPRVDPLLREAVGDEVKSVVGHVP